MEGRRGSDVLPFQTGADPEFQNGGCPIVQFLSASSGHQFYISKSKFWSKPDWGAPPGPHPLDPRLTKRGGWTSFKPCCQKGVAAH